MRRLHSTLPLSLLLLAPLPAAGVPPSPRGGCDPCDRAARALHTAAVHAAQDDYWVGVARCLNLTDPAAAAACRDEVADERAEALELLAERFEARLDLCEALGGGAHDPVIDPADFVSVVDNPWFPQLPGTTRVYEKLSEDGIETIEETVLSGTREILGVACTIVRVRELLDGELIEDTEDYYAQDLQGRVWYFGEIARNFEDGYLADLDGSWIGGVDGARPGVLVQADPVPGQVYRQEFLATEAEDAAGVVGLGRTVSVPLGVFTGCLETFELTPLEPDALEAKFYAPGVGLVLAVDLESGEREELVALP